MYFTSDWESNVVYCGRTGTPTAEVWGKFESVIKDVDGLLPPWRVPL